MSDYNHGVRVKENPTSMGEPVQGTSGLPVIIGTGPVHTRENGKETVNTPAIAWNYDEAVEKIGYSDDWGKYTLCQSIFASKKYNVFPVVFINVLDPETHAKDISSPLSWKSADQKEYTFDSADIVLDSIKVSEGDNTLEKDVDYIVTVDSLGYITLSLLGSSTYYDSGIFSITAKEISFESEEMKKNVIGGYSSLTGKNTGISCVNDVFPIHQMTPGLILAPGWSQYMDVSAALQAATVNINGEFSTNACIDIDCSENGATKCEEFAAQKEEQGVVSENAIALWPKVRVDGKDLYYSAIYASGVAYMDAANGDVPNLSPSNKSLQISATVLESGETVRIDKKNANNYVNKYGGVTAINYMGWKMWGNNTAAYPITKDPKDRWICARRFFNYYKNHLILTVAKKVDDLGNFRLLEAICDNENIWFNAMKGLLYIAGGEVSYHEEDNPIENIMEGKLVFRVKLATYLPAEDILFEVEFDPTILQQSLAA